MVFKSHWRYILVDGEYFALLLDRGVALARILRRALGVVMSRAME